MVSRGSERCGSEGKITRTSQGSPSLREPLTTPYFNVDTIELDASSTRVDVDNGASASVCVSGLITGVVNKGASLRVSCGGDVSGVEVKNGSSIS